MTLKNNCREGGTYVLVVLSFVSAVASDIYLWYICVFFGMPSVLAKELGRNHKKKKTNTQVCNMAEERTHGYLCFCTGDSCQGASVGGGRLEGMWGG